MEGLGIKRQYVGESVLAALSDGCSEIEFPTLGYFVKITPFLTTFKHKI